MSARPGVESGPPSMDARQSPDGLTRLLFRLPAELRNSIYELCLPEAKSHIKSHDPHPEWMWMACSPALFAEAGSLVYSASCFYQSLQLTLISSEQCHLVSTFRRHIHSTYTQQEQAWGWIERYAGSLIREIVLDIRMDYDNLPSLPTWLDRFFRGWQAAFPGVRRVFVFFGPDFMLGDVGVVRLRESLETSSHGGWTDFNKSPWSEHFTAAATTLDNLCPEGCEARWRVSANFNIIEAWSRSKQVPRRPRKRIMAKPPR